MSDFRIGILVFIAIAILVGGISAVAVFSDRGHNGMSGSGYMTAKEIHAVRVQLARRNAAISSRRYCRVVVKDGSNPFDPASPRVLECERRP